MRRLWVLWIVLLVGCKEQSLLAVQGYVEGESLHIGALAGGRLTALHVTKGATIAKDQPLFTLENDLETLALQEAEAGVQRAGAQRDNLLTGKRAHEIDVLVRQRDQARASQELSLLQKKRQENLLKTQATSQERLDASTAALLRDQARVAELDAAIQSAREGGREAEIVAAEATLALARNSLARAEWLLKQRTVLAPEAGRIEELLFYPGETVAANQPVLALLPPGRVTVRFFLSAAQVGRLTPSSRLSLACAGCPAGLTGRVAFIASEAVYAPPVLYSREGKEKLLFAVEAHPESLAERLHPGQPVTITLPDPS
ncbi:MAG: HlyD family efflux transporter periplasmic adaptor subunit [Magnetococcales bacterium]|nr:HlyD family efflux transporter periplasmic adaptor subunit [Magnetococcales bacterium]